MKNRIATISLLGCAVLTASIVVAESPPERPTEQKNAAPAPRQLTPEEQKTGVAAFQKVYEVLQHPRCMNCHPAGDRPLQTDQSIPHAMNISRHSAASGLACGTCHQEQNAEALGVQGGPPGAPHWQLPSQKMPLVFQGRTSAQLCAQLKDSTQNGGKTLAQVLHHVSKDPLVLWGWTPGGQRTTPPLSHQAFVGFFRTWVDLGGPCP